MATSKTIITLMLITLVSVIGAGCSDDAATTPVSVIPDVVVDTAPPAAPANLAAVYDAAGFVELSWDQNTTDADLDGYVVKRSQAGISLDLIGSPANVNSYFDFDPPMGSSEYTVYSVDLTGNESAIVSLTYDGPQYHNDDALNIQ
jgi:hypothetical protein